MDAHAVNISVKNRYLCTFQCNNSKTKIETEISDAIAIIKSRDFGSLQITETTFSLNYYSWIKYTTLSIELGENKITNTTKERVLSILNRVESGEPLNQIYKTALNRDFLKGTQKPIAPRAPRKIQAAPRQNIRVRGLNLNGN